MFSELKFLVKKKTAQLRDALAKKMELEKQSKEAQEKLFTVRKRRSRFSDVCDVWCT